MIKFNKRFPARRRGCSKRARGAEGRHPERRWLPHALAAQVLLYTTILMMLVVVPSVLALEAQVRHDEQQEAWDRALTTAAAIADSPGVGRALKAPDPTTVLRPVAESEEQQANVDFIVIASGKGQRYTHPDTAIATHIASSSLLAAQGQPVQCERPGKHTKEYCAVMPIVRIGKIVGFVLAGVGTDKVANAVDQGEPEELGAEVAGLALAIGGVAFVCRWLRRQTCGLAPTQLTRLHEHHTAVLHSVREGVLIIDGNQRIQLANDEACRQLRLSKSPEGQSVSALGLEPSFSQLLASGRVAVDEVYSVGEHVLTVNQHPARWFENAPSSVTTLRDTTDVRALTGKADGARERLELVCEATVSIGSTPDVVHTAEELASVATQGFADFVAVDLSDAVLRGDTPAGCDANLRRVAAVGIGRVSVSSTGGGVHFHSCTPQALCLAQGQSVLEPVLVQAQRWRREDPGSAERALAEGFHSLISVPIRSRGTTLGVVSFYRSRRVDPFDDQDRSTAEEIVRYAAVCIDNARRCVREHSMADSLQRRLLPGTLPDQNAVEVASRYLPAREGARGDWFDVIPLSSARVALVVGDVVGNGLHASAIMGCLRTSIHNFSILDLNPDELLARLNDLISHLDQEAATADDRRSDPLGATCVYAIYDPTTRLCTVANAGHPPPALVLPDGSVYFTGPTPGPPLGADEHRFEMMEFHAPEGSQLVLYTDGLIDNQGPDTGIGTERLRQALAAGTHESPEEACEAALGSLLHQPTDDIALLVAHTKALEERHVATWEVPADSAVIAQIRNAVAEKLTQWKLEEAIFTTQLIVSELLTNAIRYGNDPIHLRLLRSPTLVCEVSDTSSTSPHLRYASTTDENGRGLLIISELTERWGTRYTARGKTIWAEQVFP